MLAGNRRRLTTDTMKVFTATMAGSRCGCETNLELPLMELLCAFDVPLGAQVAEGPELLPPTADGALVNLQDSDGQSVSQSIK